MKHRLRIWLVTFLITAITMVHASESFGQEMVVYKIQVASFLTQYPAADIQKDLGLEQPLEIHYINGRYKYCLGQFASFEEAAVSLSDVKIEGAYIVKINLAAPLVKPSVQDSTAVSPPIREQEPMTEPEPSQTQQVTETIYAIQLAASKVFLQPESIQQKAGVAEEVRYFTKDGWYKYVIGRFASSEEAAARLNQLKVVGFVTSMQETREVVIAEDEIESPTEVSDTVQILPGVADTLARIVFTEEDMRELYALRVAEADSAFAREDWLAARKLYREALVMSPAKNYPKDRISEIDNILKKASTAPLLKGIPTITYLVVFIGLIMIVILVITLVLRTRRQKLESREKVTRQEYQDSITEYLFDENAEQPDNLRTIDSPQKKQILIDEIMQLYANLSGEISNRLRELYVDLGLDNESVQKTKSPQWHIRAKGFRELAQMNIKTVNDEIERCLNSPNDVLRMEAQLAMIRLNYDDPFSFLDKLVEPFSAWEQLHVYEMIHRYQIPVPDFTRWIHSRNITIVVFCIRMIRAYKQIEAIRELLPLLTDGSQEVREECIITLGDLQEVEVLPVLKERYLFENDKGKVLILKAMSRLPDDSNVEFLRSVLEPSNELRLEAADALARIESFGVRGIETILKRSDEDLQAVARHILDNKIQRR